MDLGKSIRRWRLVAQLTTKDRLGRGAAAMSQHTRTLEARTETADRVVSSVCPYCAVGCGQRRSSRPAGSPRSRATRIRRFPEDACAPRDRPAGNHQRADAPLEKSFIVGDETDPDIGSRDRPFEPNGDRQASLSTRQSGLCNTAQVDDVPNAWQSRTRRPSARLLDR
jgi:hypothetical protein